MAHTENIFFSKKSVKKIFSKIYHGQDLTVFSSVQMKIVRKTALVVILRDHATFNLLPINNIGSQLLKKVLKDNFKSE